MTPLEPFTDYARLREVIQGVLDRDGKHDWDETARLAELIAAKVWNELALFPLDQTINTPLTGRHSEPDNRA